jgi:hypothetical protein
LLKLTVFLLSPYTDAMFWRASSDKVFEESDVIFSCLLYRNKTAIKINITIIIYLSYIYYNFIFFLYFFKIIIKSSESSLRQIDKNY